MQQKREFIWEGKGSFPQEAVDALPEEVGPGQRQQYLQGTEHAALQKLSKDVDAVAGGKRRRPKERQRIRARRGKRKDKNKGERRQELGGET